MAIRDVREYTGEDVTRLLQYLGTLEIPDYESDIPNAEPVDLTALGDDNSYPVIETTLSVTAVDPNGMSHTFGLTLSKPAGRGGATGRGRPGVYPGQFRQHKPIQPDEPYGVILCAPHGRLGAAWWDRKNPPAIGHGMPIGPVATFEATGGTGGQGTYAIGLFKFRNK